MIVASDAEFTNVIETLTPAAAAGDVTYTITKPQANLYYKLEIDNASATSNGSVQISKIVYTNE